MLENPFSESRLPLEPLIQYYLPVILQECTDPCCNATSCTLRAGAQCASGDCCTRECQFRPLGTVCRSATQQCDIAEFCMGDSSSCPTDLHLQDGSPCNGGSDFCYTGVCENLDAQCLRFFGEYICLQTSAVNRC